jgi:hypothetical protein
MEGCETKRKLNINPFVYAVFEGTFNMPSTLMAVFSSLKKARRYIKANCPDIEEVNEMMFRVQNHPDVHFIEIQTWAVH